MNCKEIIAILEKKAPLNFQESWDNCGLLIGDRDRQIKKIMIGLDSSMDVIDQAVEQKVDLLITHHPLIFRPIKNVTGDDTQGRKILKLLTNNISCYAAHTNMDIGVMAEMSADKLELSDKTPLSITISEKIYKLAVFIPEGYADIIREVMAGEGAGDIGDYSNCTFQSSGMGTFVPKKGTDPFVGEVGQFTRTNEVKLETVVPESKLTEVIKAMLGAHPYEEPAYDVYELKIIGKEEGAGRIGFLQQEQTLEECALNVKNLFHASKVKVVGNLNKKIKKIAIIPGSGGSFIKDAIKKKADVLITGDISHHEALDALEEGLSIIDAGHFTTEHFVVEYIKELLESNISQSDYEEDLKDYVIVTAKESNPFTFI